MAFIDIKDPERREEIVKDYVKNLKEIRERNENEKVRGITQQQEIAKVFQPVVKATEKSASQITSELKNLKEQEQVKKEEPKVTNKALEYYFNQYMKSKLDQYFGVYKENGVYMMGHKEIVVDDRNNIYLDNGADVYKGTKGLWNLIMSKTPTAYHPEDLDNYKRLIERTNAIEMPHITTPNDRPKKTAKWRFFKDIGLVPETRNEDETDEDEFEDAENFEKDGSGITFLPGDINGLLEKFHLLLAEHRAGNKSSTKNQIVAILDQLLRLNYLNQEEYNYACKELSC